MTEQWSAERANEWFASIPLPFGCNFLPSTAVNSTEMWQAETFDPATIERELRFAAGLGYNTVRVFLQFMVWEADPAGHHERLETFLRLADAAGITMMPILFDDCRFDGRDPYPGPQDDPTPGVHNSRWTPSPGYATADDRRAGRSSKRTSATWSERSATTAGCWCGTCTTNREGTAPRRACRWWRRRSAGRAPPIRGSR